MLERGVSGGVGEAKAGGAVNVFEPEAATLGRFEKLGVGLLTTTFDGFKEDCVATDEAELDLVGLAGRIEAMGDGDSLAPESDLGNAGMTGGGWTVAEFSVLAFAAPDLIERARGAPW